MTGRLAAAVAALALWPAYSLLLFTALEAAPRFRRPDRGSDFAPGSRFVSVLRAAAVAIGPLAAITLFFANDGDLVRYLRWGAIVLAPVLVAHFVIAVLPAPTSRQDADDDASTQPFLVDVLRTSALPLAVIVGVLIAGDLPWVGYRTYNGRGFTFEYPDDWEPSEQPLVRIGGETARTPVVEISPPDMPVPPGPSISVMVYPPQEAAAADLLFRLVANGGSAADDVNVPGARSAELREYDVAQFFGGGHAIHVIAVGPDGRTFSLTAQASTERFDDYEDAFRRAVDTFRITSAATSG